ncbi:MAG: hypothetical protein ACI4FV_09970 [Lachnospiraceae bacterium]
MNRSKTSLFLMELIIAILFFSLACAVCIQLFFKAHQVSRKSEDLSSAVLWCENVAELFRGCDGDMAEMTALLVDTDHFQITTNADNGFSIFFDKDWNPITEASHVTYEIQCEIYDKDDYQTAVITASDGSEELYSLTSDIYQGK